MCLLEMKYLGYSKVPCLETSLFTKYSVHYHARNVWFQKISIPPPQGVTGNSEGEGVLKAKIFTGKYEPKLEFLEGWGIQTKTTPSVGGIWIFAGTTIFESD